MQLEKLTVADLFFIEKETLENPLNKEDFLEFLYKFKNYSKTPITKIFESHYEDYLEIFNVVSEKNIKRRYFNSLNKVFKYWSTQNTSIDFYLCRGYSLEESKYMLKNRQSTMNANTAKKIQNSLNLKSKEEKDDINRRKGNCNRFEFYLNKINENTGKLYTEDEAKNKIKNKQSKAFTRRWKLIKEGKIRYFTNTSINYYLDKGLCFDDAKNALIERQKTFSLQKCIEKHGKDLGIKIFNDRQIKWQKTLNDKSDEEKESIKRSQYSRLSKYSKASFEYFTKILNNIELNTPAYFGEDEYVIYDKNKSRCYFFDFVIPEYKICIEYNGLAFHPHPDLNETERLLWKDPFTKMNYAEKTEFDNYKNSLILSKGYDLLIIWENDEDTIQKAINFIKYKIEKYANRTN